MRKPLLVVPALSATLPAGPARGQDRTDDQLLAAVPGSLQESVAARLDQIAALLEHEREA